MQVYAERLMASFGTPDSDKGPALNWLGGG
jgi:hypothetical protein